MQTITRKGSFDSMHRVMNERYKCFNIHGHTYLYELTFSFEKTEKIGYALDFKEIKRIACQFIDDYFDHGAILNPHDKTMIEASQKLNSKLWIVSLNGDEYCNPSVENIAKELFLAVEYLMQGLLTLENIVIYETPNCFTTCSKISINLEETRNFFEKNLTLLDTFKQNKGILQYYDESKI